MTGRLPFDPARMAASRKRDDEPWTVSLLADRIDAAFKTGLPKTVRVRGEVSGFRDRTHWYFDLKDEHAVVGVTMFASAARRARERPVNGQSFIVTGRVEFYAAGGRTSIMATSLARVGLGELEEKYRALCEELRALGWFADERKRPLPAFPRRVAIVTSRSGAALQDVLDTARRRMPGIELILVDARVQGSGAAAEIAAAVRALGRRHARLGIDAILVTRGGGSMEDLWAFNERIVAEAIVECPVPVVAAIGHETDTTIAELVADLRCATPTQAAMKLIPDRIAMLAQVDSLARRMRGDVRRQLDAARRLIEAHRRRPSLASPAGLFRSRRDQLDRSAHRLETDRRHMLEQERARLDRFAARLARVSPRMIQAQRRATVGEAQKRLRRVLHRRVERTREHLAEVDRRMEAVSPLTVLERGYSITLDESGRAVRSVRGLRPGDRLTTRVSDGRIHSTVEGQDESGSAGRAARPARRARRARPDDPPQMDLFAPGG